MNEPKKVFLGAHNFDYIPQIPFGENTKEFISVNHLIKQIAKSRVMVGTTQMIDADELLTWIKSGQL